MAMLSLKRKLWLDHIRNQKASGFTVVQYCKENNLSEKSYWYYHRQLSDELEKGYDENQMHQLIPLNILKDEQSNEFSITITNGNMQVCINPDMDEEKLIRFLRVFKNA